MQKRKFILVVKLKSNYITVPILVILTYEVAKVLWPILGKIDIKILMGTK